MDYMTRRKILDSATTGKHPSSTREVNAAIKKAGGKEKLVKGAGYFYFMDGDADKWHTSSVMVFRVSALTIDQWVEEWRSLRDDYLKRK